MFVSKSSKQDTNRENNGAASCHDDSLSERPLKRRRQDETKDSDTETGHLQSPCEGENRAQKEAPRKVHLRVHEKGPASHGATAVEDVLPPTQIDDSAIEEYEHKKASRLDTEGDDAAKKTKSLWIKGRSSIYVDAFNLALDTVLEEESVLFDEKEMEVFQQWKQLDYETQYLSVFRSKRLKRIKRRIIESRSK